MGLIEKIKAIAEFEEVPESHLYLENARGVMSRHHYSRISIRIAYEEGNLSTMKLVYGKGMRDCITVYNRKMAEKKK